MEECHIALPDPAALELLGEVTENLRPAGQEDNPARLPVETVHGMNPEPGITVDPFPQLWIGLNS